MVFVALLLRAPHWKQLKWVLAHERRNTRATKRDNTQVGEGTNLWSLQQHGTTRNNFRICVLSGKRTTKNQKTYRPNSTAPRYTPKRNENRCSKKSLHMCVHSSTIRNSQKGGNNPSVYQLMNEQTLVPPHKGILRSHKKERSPDIHYHLDGPRKHRVEWKQSDTKGHTV